MTTITLPRPDDWHLHVRDDAALKTTIPATASQFARAIIMPNLVPPITTVAEAKRYCQRIVACIPEHTHFKPLMTLYLTDQMSSKTLTEAKSSGIIYAVKLYPAGATTHSAAGIKNLLAIYPALEVMEQLDLPLLIHGEVTDPAVDIFDREKEFIHSQLTALVERFPKLRIVLEHITTRTAVDFIMQAPENVAATITAHHLLANRNALLAGGLHVHNYCLPILKRANDQNALLQAATSGNPKFFLGTDSAPHIKSAKEAACGCAGIYTAPIAMALYTTAFESCNALDKLADFASHFGADFYRLKRNTHTITLEKKPYIIPEYFTLGADKVVPFKAGETLAWSLLSDAQ